MIMITKQAFQACFFNTRKGGVALTEKQKLFCDEYLIDLNATRAYKAVYTRVKNDSTAAVNASKLLRNTNVSAYIEKRMAERSKRTEVKQDDVIKELAKIGFARTALLYEMEVKTNDKLKALELLGRHLGMFTDKQEIKAQISYEEFLSKAGGDYEY